MRPRFAVLELVRVLLVSPAGITLSSNAQLLLQPGGLCDKLYTFTRASGWLLKGEKSRHSPNKTHHLRGLIVITKPDVLTPFKAVPFKVVFFDTSNCRFRHSSRWVPQSQKVSSSPNSTHAASWTFAPAETWPCHQHCTQLKHTHAAFAHAAKRGDNRNKASDLG